MTDGPPLARLFALVRRELRADDVRLLAVAPTAPNVLCVALPDGRLLAATFATTPTDRDALLRRLEMLVHTFAQALGDPPVHELRAIRAPIRRSLHEELRALATRARATDAVVIDAHSPVIWGSAIDPDPQNRVDRTPEVETALELLTMSRRQLLEGIPDAPPSTGDFDEATGTPPASTADLVRPVQDVGLHVVTDDTGDDTGVRPLHDADADPPPADADASHDGDIAVEDVARASSPPAPPRLVPPVVSPIVTALRAHPAIASLKRGRPMRETARGGGGGGGYVARSFASIYLLVLVFDAPFDELRAERAVDDALARIERLVLALPPLDPEPSPFADVVSLRARRRG